MVVGYSPLTYGEGLSHRFLEFDVLVSAISIGCPIKLGFPQSSCGRNLAYRKADLDRAGGYSAMLSFRSGDDTHLTERFRNLGLGRVEYCSEPSTFVLTRSPTSIKNFIQQQIRKRSKLVTKSRAAICLSSSIFLSYCTLFGLPILAGSLLDPYFISIFFLRYILEQLCLFKACKVYEARHLTRWIPAFHIIYPFHIVMFSFLGIFQRYRWKGR